MFSNYSWRSASYLETDKDGTYLNVELPGFRKEDVRVELGGSILHVEAKRGE
jgi:HSP20 family molecular chaperone IbpA